MNRMIPIAVLIASFALVLAPTHGAKAAGVPPSGRSTPAGEANGDSLASIVGIVSDPTNKGFLPGASVTLAETGATERTNSEGRFQFRGLGAGNYSLSVSYLGYESKTVNVRVGGSAETMINVIMDHSVVELSRFVVEGYREGRSRAMQQKRTQTNITDIVSADAIGNLPDRNVAEAVARLPGVSMSLLQGEGNYVSIRGAHPNLNQVLLDGATMSAPGGTEIGRSVPLDVISAGRIQQIEVVKSVTPDLDANAIGGTINIRSTSAFEKRGRFIAGSVSGSVNESRKKYHPEGQLTYSDLFGAHQTWGVAASATYFAREYSNQWLQSSGWAQRTFNGITTYLPNTLEIKPDGGKITRQGVNLNVEFRPNADAQFYLRPSLSTGSRVEDRYETTFVVSNTAGVTLTSPTTGTFAGNGTRTQRREIRIDRDQELLNIAAGFKKTAGNFIFEPMVSFSGAKETRNYDRNLQFRNAIGDTGPVQFDISRFDFGPWRDGAPGDIPARYELQMVIDADGLVSEDTVTAKADLRWATTDVFRRRSFLKAGVKYTHRDRMQDLDSLRLVPNTTWSLANIGVNPGMPVYNGRYQSGFLVNWDRTWAFLAANPTVTRVDPVATALNSIEEDYTINEYIYAGYLMGSLDFGHLTLLGGARWEKTDVNIRSVEGRFASGALLGRFPTVGTTSYDKLLPNLQAVYRFTDQLVLRGALTQTIGRPAYEDARPLATFNYSPLGAAASNPLFPYTGSLAIGNPDLKPLHSTNYEFSIEWYNKSHGLFSVAAFHKDIADPIYSYNDTLRNVTHSGIALENLTVTSRLNAGNGRISGLELNFYQPFRFLPGPFNGFGVDANFTKMRSRVSIPTRRNENFPFFRQPRTIASFTLFYEKAKFSGRLAWTYSDGHLYTIGAALLQDIYRREREQYDLLLRYRVSEHFSITGSVRNLTREPERFSYGISTLMRSCRLLERDYKLGVDFNF